MAAAEARGSPSEEMTCCLIVAFPDIVIAAADTRITVHGGPGEAHVHDGPEDLEITLPAGTAAVLYPYRKLRFLQSGWAVVAGEFTSGYAMLGRIQSASAATFDSALALVNAVRPALFERVNLETGIAESELSETVILGAALNSSLGTWCIGLREDDSRSRESAGQYQINFPNDVPERIKQGINSSFVAELAEAYNSQNAMEMVIAAARVIAVAAEHSETVSQRVQVGISRISVGGVSESRYFDDSVEGVLACSPANFYAKSSRAT